MYMIRSSDQRLFCSSARRRVHSASQLGVRCESCAGHGQRRVSSFVVHSHSSAYLCGKVCNRAFKVRFTRFLTKLTLRMKFCCHSLCSTLGTQFTSLFFQVHSTVGATKLYLTSANQFLLLPSGSVIVGVLCSKHTSSVKFCSRVFAN